VDVIAPHERDAIRPLLRADNRAISDVDGIRFRDATNLSMTGNYRVPKFVTMPRDGTDRPESRRVSRMV
jgi:hypothetical protein